MNSDAERTLSNLNVLGAVSQNDKLMTNDDQFNIYTPTTFRALVRTWYGERRYQNVQRVRATIHTGITFAQTFLDDATRLIGDPSTSSSHTAAVDAVRLRIDTMVIQHVRMCDALEGSIRGLTNMLQTYRDDAALNSQLNALVQEVRDYLAVIEPYSRPVRERIVARTSAAAPPPPPLPPLVLASPSSPPSGAYGASVGS